MPSGQTLGRIEIYANGGNLVGINVFTSPNGFSPRAFEVNETNWPGLEASCQSVLGAELWADLKAADPIPDDA
jgi:hypothetical protein